MAKNQKINKKPAVKKKNRVSHEFETMSQVQNRYGQGRQQNGSDGSSTQVTGNNH